MAANLTINLTIPTQSDPVPVMSVFAWIIIHQHIPHAFDWHLRWAAYKAGFGSIDADYWLGLEKVHLLTSSRPYRLRVEVQHRSTHLWYSAEYWSFQIGDELNDKYRLNVSGYSGDAGDSLQHEGDWNNNGKFGSYGIITASLDRTWNNNGKFGSDGIITASLDRTWNNNGKFGSYGIITASLDRTWNNNGKFGSYYNNRMKFTTRNRDNDNFRGNCARGRGGGWWYNACFWACLTCNRDNHQWWSVGNLANSRMMIKPQ